MNRLLKIIWLVGILSISLQDIHAQAFRGTTGLLHAPIADMQEDKTFMFGGNVLHLVPLNYIWSNEIKYTFNYYINIIMIPRTTICRDSK